MLNLWKKRRQNPGRQAPQAGPKPDLDNKESLCDAPDTVKLVSGERLTEKEALSSHGISITFMETPADDEDINPRRLSTCSLIQAEDAKKSKHPRRLSGPNIKWTEAPLGKVSEKVDIENDTEESASDTSPTNPSTGGDDFRAQDSVARDMSDDRGLASVSIPEETDGPSDGASSTVVTSSTETLDDCKEARKRRRHAPLKAEHRTVFNAPFPGLRKDSIDIYKMKKQNQDQSRVEASEDQYPTGTTLAASNDPPHVSQTDLPNPSILKRRSSKLYIDKEVTQSVFTILSGMYAMFLTILGAVLPIAELFAQEKHPLLFEVFYIYMYGGSILFLGYVYTYLLRSRAAKKTKPPGQSQKKKHRKRKVTVDKVSSNTGSFYLRLGAVAFGIGSMIHSGLQFGDYFEIEVLDPCRHAVFAIRPIVHLMFTFVQLYFVFLNSKMCINRYKVIARFGLMHMVATNICVWFNTIVEETLHQLKTTESTSHHVLAEALYSQEHTTTVPNRTLLADVNRRYSVNVSTRGRAPMNVHGTVAHLTTTTAQLISKHGHLNPQNVTHESSFPSAVLPVVGTHYDCQTSQLMLSVLETVGPYLYPCSIEYSLICAGIVYTLWKNIGKRVMAIKSEDDKDDSAVVHRLRVDCSKSSRGLFLGILVLVGTIITMVVFFVLVKTPAYNRSAIMVEYLSEITLFTLSSIAVVMAAMRMRYLRFNIARDTDFEEVLILISLTGDYMFQMLSIVAAIFDKEQFASRLSIAACLLGITQSTIQTMFVLDGLRRCARTAEQGRQKRGREYVTFLLITNIAMWCINTFEAERTVANPVQMHYYGALAWNILSHISIPLAIFFRFHSTVCLSNIWKGAWKN